MNHKWDKDLCIKCGLTRKKIAVKHLMAITNHEPYNHYMHEQLYQYRLGNDAPWVTKRPECKKLENEK